MSDFTVSSQTNLLNVQRLTVEVERDGAGDGRHQVVVGRLAREDGVQVSPLQPLQMQHVPHLLLRQRLVRVIQ